jgi:hypothetical protein
MPSNNGGGDVALSNPSNGLQALRCMLTNAVPKKKARGNLSYPEIGDAEHSVAVLAAVVMYSAVAFI